METQARIDRLSDEEFQRKYGVNRKTFEAMEEVLQEKYSKNHAKGGRKPKLSIRDCLCVFLMYYREYRAMENIAIDYDVANSTLCDAIHWTEDTLVKSGLFSLHSKRSLCEGDMPDIVLIDVNECETERPKKSNANPIQEKRKKHTLKAQLVLNSSTEDILCVFFAKWHERDFTMFKDSRLPLMAETTVIVDKGYQGITKK